MRVSRTLQMWVTPPTKDCTNRLRPMPARRLMRRSWPGRFTISLRHSLFPCIQYDFCVVEVLGYKTSRKAGTFYIYGAEADSTADELHVVQLSVWRFLGCITLPTDVHLSRECIWFFWFFLWIYIKLLSWCMAASLLRLHLEITYYLREKSAAYGYKYSHANVNFRAELRWTLSANADKCTQVRGRILDTLLPSS